MAGTEINLPYNYWPRSYQAECFAAADRGIRRFFTVWHRRAGKDKHWLNFMVRESYKRVGNYFYFFPTYKQAKKVIWKGVDGHGLPMLFSHIPKALVAATNETELLITFKNGSTMQLIGTDNMDANVGTNAVGMVFSEYSIQSPRAYELMRPVLSENRGWAAFNCTPRGENHAKELWDAAITNPGEWYTSLRTVDETLRDSEMDRRPDSGGSIRYMQRVTTQEDVEKEIRDGMDPEVAQQEFFCSWRAPRAGAYYGRWMQEMETEDRVTAVPWDPQLPVFTAWDLGIADSTAVVFAQWHGEMLHLIDYYEVSGLGLSDIAAVIRGRPYTYSGHYAPHDIKQREYSTGRSRLEAAQDLGLNFHIVPSLDVAEGHDSVRRMLPRIRMDKIKCLKLIRHLKNYHKEYDEDTNTYSDKPVHDASSHGADAVRYLSLIFERERPEYHTEVQVVGLNDSPFKDWDVGLDDEAERW